MNSFFKLRNYRLWEVPLLCLLCFVLVGCGNSNQKDLAVVNGAVTLNGKPFTESSSVTFIPIPNGKMASGIVKSDGTFHLKTYVDQDGAIIGKHRVFIGPIEATVPGSAEGPDVVPPSSIPSRYRSAETSGWEVEVVGGKVNNIQLEMNTKK